MDYPLEPVRRVQMTERNSVPESTADSAERTSMSMPRRHLRFSIRRPYSPRGLVGLTLAGTLVAVGCSPGPVDPGSSLQPESTSSAHAASPGTSRTSDTTETEPESESFEAFFGVQLFFEDPGAAEAARQEEIRQYEEAVRACMVVEGFDYTPVLPEVESVLTTEGTVEDQVRRWGFRITTEAGSGLPSVMDSALIYGEPLDPNADLVESMSEAERAAWNEALENCGTEAWFARPATLYETALYGAMFAELDEMQERLEADPRIVDLEAAWSGCMATAGYEYADRDTLLTVGMTDLVSRFNALMGVDATFDPFAGWTADDTQAFFDGKSTEEIETFFVAADQERLERVDRQALVVLQQAEIDLAVTDFECRRGLEYAEVHRQVRQEYEADFIDTNRSELEQNIASFRQR